MATRQHTKVERPAGLVYAPDFITRDEERSLAAFLDGMELFEVRMRGQVAKRTTRHFGWTYDYERARVAPAEPLPESLEWLRDRSAALAGLPPEALAETLVTLYPPAAGIGWHRDAPMFGPTVVGVSLLSPCRMRFRRDKAGDREVYEVALAPRSAYVLAGAARSSWQHSIPATKGRRYSITFRMVRTSAAGVTTAGAEPPD